MAAPTLKSSEAERRGAAMKAATQRGCFCVVSHSEAISKAITQKATHRAVPVQQDNSRGRIREQAVFALAIVRQEKPP